MSLQSIKNKLTSIKTISENNSLTNMENGNQDTLAIVGDNKVTMVNEIFERSGIAKSTSLRSRLDKKLSVATDCYYDIIDTNLKLGTGDGYFKIYQDLNSNSNIVKTSTNAILPYFIITSDKIFNFDYDITPTSYSINYKIYDYSLNLQDSGNNNFKNHVEFLNHYNLTPQSVIGPNVVYNKRSLENPQAANLYYYDRLNNGFIELDVENANGAKTVMGYDLRDPKNIVTNKKEQVLNVINVNDRLVDIKDELPASKTASAFKAASPGGNFNLFEIPPKYGPYDDMILHNGDIICTFYNPTARKFIIKRFTKTDKSTLNYFDSVVAMSNEITANSLYGIRVTINDDIIALYDNNLHVYKVSGSTYAKTHSTTFGNIKSFDILEDKTIVAGCDNGDVKLLNYDGNAITETSKINNDTNPVIGITHSKKYSLFMYHSSSKAYFIKNDGTYVTSYEGNGDIICGKFGYVKDNEEYLFFGGKNMTVVKVIAQDNAQVVPTGTFKYNYIRPYNRDSDDVLSVDRITVFDNGLVGVSAPDCKIFNATSNSFSVINLDTFESFDDIAMLKVFNNAGGVMVNNRLIVRSGRNDSLISAKGMFNTLTYVAKRSNITEFNENHLHKFVWYNDGTTFMHLEIIKDFKGYVYSQANGISVRLIWNKYNVDGTRLASGEEVFNKEDYFFKGEHTIAYADNTFYESIFENYKYFIIRFGIYQLYIDKQDSNNNISKVKTVEASRDWYSVSINNIITINNSLKILGGVYYSSSNYYYGYIINNFPINKSYDHNYTLRFYEDTANDTSSISSKYFNKYYSGYKHSAFFLTNSNNYELRELYYIQAESVYKHIGYLYLINQNNRYYTFLEKLFSPLSSNAKVNQDYLNRNEFMNCIDYEFKSDNVINIGSKYNKFIFFNKIYNDYRFNRLNIIGEVKSNLIGNTLLGFGNDEILKRSTVDNSSFGIITSHGVFTAIVSPKKFGTYDYCSFHSLNLTGKFFDGNHYIDNEGNIYVPTTGNLKNDDCTKDLYTFMTKKNNQILAKKQNDLIVIKDENFEKPTSYTRIRNKFIDISENGMLTAKVCKDTLFVMSNTKIYIYKLSYNEVGEITNITYVKSLNESVRNKKMEVSEVLGKVYYTKEGTNIIYGIEASGTYNTFHFAHGHTGNTAAFTLNRYGNMLYTASETGNDLYIHDLSTQTRLKTHVLGYRSKDLYSFDNNMVYILGDNGSLERLHLITGIKETFTNTNEYLQNVERFIPARDGMYMIGPDGLVHFRNSSTITNLDCELVLKSVKNTYGSKLWYKPYEVVEINKNSVYLIYNSDTNEGGIIKRVTIK